MAELGNLYIISAPSGTGKTTLVKAILATLPGTIASISYTTRPKRPNEQDGVHYYFVSVDEFLRMRDATGFVEYAFIFGHWYGTSRQKTSESLAKGLDTLLVIDWQGAEQIRYLYPDCISIFILPPSIDSLIERLSYRRHDKPEVIAERVQDARLAITHAARYDYIVVNDNFDETLSELKTIICAGRFLTSRQMIKQAERLALLQQQTASE